MVNILERLAAKEPDVSSGVGGKHKIGESYIYQIATELHTNTSTAKYLQDV